MDTFARIQREFFIRDRPIRKIVHDLHVCRSTGRWVARSGDIAEL